MNLHRDEERLYKRSPCSVPIQRSLLALNFTNVISRTSGLRSSRRDQTPCRRIFTSPERYAAIASSSDPTSSDLTSSSLSVEFLTGADPRLHSHSPLFSNGYVRYAMPVPRAFSAMRFRIPGEGSQGIFNLHSPPSRRYMPLNRFAHTAPPLVSQSEIVFPLVRPGDERKGVIFPFSYFRIEEFLLIRSAFGGRGTISGASSKGRRVKPFLPPMYDLRPVRTRSSRAPKEIGRAHV